jgi:hypothetical protein
MGFVAHELMAVQGKSKPKEQLKKNWINISTAPGQFKPQGGSTFNGN